MAKFPRRSLRFVSFEDYVREIESLDDARRRGGLNRVGRWSLDECCQHLGRWIEFSIDGFPFGYPLRFRVLGRLVRLVSWRWLVALAIRPGFENPASARAVEPDPQIAEGNGVQYLLEQLARLENGVRMVQPSPVEGPITHEQWRYFHLRHAEMHLSFQVPEGEWDGA